MAARNAEGPVEATDVSYSRTVVEAALTRGESIIVNGAVWGLMTIASTDAPLPENAEDRLAG